MFHEAASQDFMVPLMSGRFLVARSPFGGIVVAFGGGGFYQTETTNADGETSIRFHSVVRSHAAYHLNADVALALSQSLLAMVNAEGGEEPVAAGDGE